MSAPWRLPFVDLMLLGVGRTVERELAGETHPGTLLDWVIRRIGIWRPDMAAPARRGVSSWLRTCFCPKRSRKPPSALAASVIPYGVVQRSVADFAAVTEPKRSIASSFLVCCGLRTARVVVDHHRAGGDTIVAAQVAHAA
jgi:hypothetical protein